MTYLLILPLLVLHHDFRGWADGRLVLGFLPIGLAHHALLSVAAWEAKQSSG